MCCCVTLWLLVPSPHSDPVLSAGCGASTVGVGAETRFPRADTVNRPNPSPVMVYDLAGICWPCSG